jgi:hypothetical protein
METGKGLILTILTQNKFIYKFCLSINLTLYLHITQIKILIKLKFMKQKLTLILALSLLATSAFSQKAKKGDGDKKGSLFGVHFNMADFKAPLGIKDPITGKVYSKFKDMDKGFSLSYWKGLNRKFDFSIKATAMFREYSKYFTNYVFKQKTEIGVELEPSIKVRRILYG